MPFARDTVAVITSKTLADIQSAIAGVDPLLQKSILNIVGVTLSEGMNSLYGYLDYIGKQAIPFTAVGEAFYAWAALKGQFPKAASAADGSFVFAASALTLIPAGTLITRSDGVAYLTTADAAVSGNSIEAPVVALVAGSAGTIVNGVGGALSAPIAGVASGGTGVAGDPGADIEAFEAFKTRVLQVFAQPPQGGDIGDYVEWSEAVTGVTRAWCRPNGLGAGTVVVYFMMDVVRAVDAGFPQGTGGVAAAETRDAAATGDQLLVANAIFPLRPVTALVYALAPGQNTVNFSITLPGASVALKAAVAAAIAAVMLAYGSPGGVILPDLTPAGVMDLSIINAAIASIAGTTGFVITADSCNHGTISPGPAGNIASATGFLPVLGALTWA